MHGVSEGKESLNIGWAIKGSQLAQCCMETIPLPTPWRLLNTEVACAVAEANCTLILNYKTTSTYKIIKSRRWKVQQKKGGVVSDWPQAPLLEYPTNSYLFCPPPPHSSCLEFSILIPSGIISTADWPATKIDVHTPIVSNGRGHAGKLTRCKSYSMRLMPCSIPMQRPRKLILLGSFII